MYHITLISTHHGELGRCNADELYKIIQSIQPDVIFEELPEELFDKVYKLPEISIEPPETKSVKRYLQTRAVKHIPVDLAPIFDTINDEIYSLFDAFKNDNAYRECEEEQIQRTVNDGFSFLNSKKSEELIEEKNKIVNRLLESTLYNDYLPLYKLFCEKTSNRENEMLKKIYEYSKEYPYSKAIFLIGASHRNSIKQKIQEYELKERFKLNWLFYN